MEEDLSRLKVEKKKGLFKNLVREWKRAARTKGLYQYAYFLAEIWLLQSNFKMQDPVFEEWCREHGVPY